MIHTILTSFFLNARDLLLNCKKSLRMQDPAKELTAVLIWLLYPEYHHPLAFARMPTASFAATVSF
jgi:hypothetical protein